MPFKFQFFILFFSICLIAGCASAGHEINSNEIEKIKIGVTTKDEMFAMFGSPISQSYSPEGKLTLIWQYIHVGPFGMGMRQQNLAVLFNQNNIVEKFNLFDNSDNGVRPGY